MKHLLPAFALLISSLFAPVAVSAAPLVCSGPTGLVYILAVSCAAANVGGFPGFTVGNCLVVQADFSLGGGACGGGGGSNFPTGIMTGIPGADGPFAVVSSLGGPVSFTTNSVITVSPLNVPGSDLLITDSTNGAILAVDSFGNIGLGVAGISSGNINTWGTVTGGQVISRGQASGGVTSAPGYVDSGSSGASMQLGQSGAPSGLCIPGSLYTQFDGTLATTLYVCGPDTAWHAVTIP